MRASNRGGGGRSGGAPVDLREPIEHVAAALEEGLARGDLSGFYRAFRATELPFLGLRLGDRGELLFRACFDVLHRLGGLSPAVALAVENHFYVTSAIATFPIGDDPALERRRRALLEQIVEGRLLVANTNSRVHADRIGAIGTRARRVPGGFQISGTASYASMASEGDLLIFITVLEEEQAPAVFMARPRDNPGIVIGDNLFPAAMLDSDTRQITFQDLFLPEEALLLGGRGGRMQQLLAFEMVWHQTLIPALYLGAAAGAIEEARRFLRSVRTGEGRPLAELDGMVVDVGRLALRYQGACCVVQRAGEAIGAVDSPARLDRLLGELFELASAAKYLGTRCAEDVVTAARRIVGARAFRGGQRLERLSQEVVFGPLGPEVSAAIERAHGQRALGEHPFEGRGFPWSPGDLDADQEEPC